MAGIGPQLPLHLRLPTTVGDDDECGIPIRPQLQNNEVDKIKLHGPALPPGYTEKKQSGNCDVIGPKLPNNLYVNKCNDDDSHDDDDDDDIIGPSLPCDSSEQSESNELIQTQFEARAKAMKNKLTGNNLEDENLTRESWMLELPPEIGKNFGLGPRTFRTKAVDLGDRSVWTDTPADRERKREKRKEVPEDQSAKKRKLPTPTSEELEMKARVEEYNQKSRPQSLLDMHREKHKKEESGVRRPFDRDKDLALHRKDPKEKAKFIEGAKQMNQRFSAGNFEDKFL